MLKTNLRGQIRQTQLPKWRPLLPLFEAVMNALQAIQEAPDRQHEVRIEIHRDIELELGEDPLIRGFTVSDTGVGFDDDNFDSFNTAFSEWKLRKGGKGLGRFLWLKAFEKVVIDSFFIAEGEGTIRRSFTFDPDYDPDLAPSHAVESGRLGTKVQLINYQAPWKMQCPRQAEQIALRLIEHFILVFVRSDCPKIFLVDQGLSIDLNAIFASEYRHQARTENFQVDGVDFEFFGFRLSAGRLVKHKLLYAANQRSVVTERLEDFMPNLVGKLPGALDGEYFIYLAVVQSLYLDSHVNNSRTDFDLASADDAEAEQGQLFEPTITRSSIRKECLDLIDEDLRVHPRSHHDVRAMRRTRSMMAAA